MSTEHQWFSYSLDTKKKIFGGVGGGADPVGA